MGDCPFCEILAGRAPANIAHEWDDAIALHPLGPVTPGHILIVPREHVADFGEAPDVSAATMRRAAEYIQGQEGAWNVITSRGRIATQSVWHLHLHLVPRRENDRLALPWHSGKHTKGRVAEGGADRG